MKNLWHSCDVFRIERKNLPRPVSLGGSVCSGENRWVGENSFCLGFSAFLLHHPIGLGKMIGTKNMDVRGDEIGQPGFDQFYRGLFDLGPIVSDDRRSVDLYHAAHPFDDFEVAPSQIPVAFGMSDDGDITH